MNSLVDSHVGSGTECSFGMDDTSGKTFRDSISLWMSDVDICVFGGTEVLMRISNKSHIFITQILEDGLTSQFGIELVVINHMNLTF